MVAVPVPFAEWRPDLALLDNEFASVAENVFAGENSYLPFPGFAPQMTTALPANCIGLGSAQTSTGSWKIYAGTATKLYRYSGGAWVEAGSGYSAASGDLWRFQQNGTKLVATQISNNPQVIDVDSGTNFADLTTSPPKARHVAQVGPHLVLSGLATNGRTIHWSAVEDIHGWSIGTNLSDAQEMPEGGQVQGVAGGEIGYIVQERAIRTMQYLPGDTTIIFTISRVVQDRGCISKYGFTAINGVLYFPAEDGFFALAGQQLVAIGEGKVNDWFLRNSDPSRRNLILAFDFQHAHRIGWAFHSSTGSQTYDAMLIYDWALQRWTVARIAAQMWASLASSGTDLDTNDPADLFDPLLDSVSPSLDSYGYMGGRPVVGAVNGDGILSFLSGSSLPATLETAERHFVPTMRAFVSEVYPLIDITSGVAFVGLLAGTREQLQEPIQWGAPVAPGIGTGSAPVLSSARLHRFRMITHPGSIWTHAQGVVAEAQPDGYSV